MALWRRRIKKDSGLIADLLSDANPKHWPRSVTRPMLREHIDTTVVYATDLLKGDYANAVKHFDEADDHIMMLADILAKGIVAQFPDKFCQEPDHRQGGSGRSGGSRLPSGLRPAVYHAVHGAHDPCRQPAGLRAAGPGAGR